MWRVILLSFAFLGLAFYVASGGADYTPAPNSLQVAWRDKPFFAPARAIPPPARLFDVESTAPQLITRQSKNSPRQSAEPETAPESASAQQAAAPEPASYIGLSELWLDEEGGSDLAPEDDLTLAAPARPVDSDDTPEPSAIERIGVFDAQTLASDVHALPLQEPEQSTPVLADIRQIAGDTANMRSGPGTGFPAIDQLARGTSVEVLARRGAWVELLDLQTGQIGWMADWLITAAQ